MLRKEVSPSHDRTVFFHWRAKLAAGMAKLAGKVPLNQKWYQEAAVRQEAAVILAEYGEDLFRFAYTYQHDLLAAEAVLKETLADFIKQQPVFAAEEEKRSWLLRKTADISKQHCRDLIGRRDRLKEELQDSKQPQLAIIWQGWKELPETYREVLHLFYYEQYSTKEIAALLDKHEATVRSHLSRGLMKLQPVLKEETTYERNLSKNRPTA